MDALDELLGLENAPSFRDDVSLLDRSDDVREILAEAGNALSEAVAAVVAAYRDAWPSIESALGDAVAGRELFFYLAGLTVHFAAADYHLDPMEEFALNVVLRPGVEGDNDVDIDYIRSIAPESEAMIKRSLVAAALGDQTLGRASTDALATAGFELAGLMCRLDGEITEDEARSLADLIRWVRDLLDEVTSDPGARDSWSAAGYL